MNDFEQPPQKYLGGAVLAYVCVVSAPGVVWNAIYSWAYVTSGIYVWDAMLRFVAFAAYAIGLCLILCVRKPLTREYTIWLNLCLAFVSVISLFVVEWPEPGLATIVFRRAPYWFFLWTAFWMQSDRVKRTFCPKNVWIP